MRAARLTLADRASGVKGALRDPAVLGLDGLRREGTGWKANCVWHSERTGSLSLQQYDDGIGAHCFGCQRGGTVLDLIAAIHRLDARMDFIKVIEIGEQIAGIMPGSVPTPRPAARPTPPRVPPPAIEVRGLWDASLPVSNDTEVTAWLESRRIDVDRVEERNLARVLPPDIGIPRWAYGPAGAWNDTGHRLVLPTFDEVGVMVSMRARRISGNDPRKTLSPAKHSKAGVFADALARRLLCDGTAPPWWSERRCMITEGIPDFLILATIHGDDTDTPAVFGIESGAWSDAIAARIPDGCRVELACDADEAGTRYGDEIARTLEKRCEVFDVEVGHGA